MRLTGLLAVALLSTAALGKTAPNAATLEKRVAALEKQLEELKPGLGEIMGVVQQHHVKLFFAGTSGNWDLAVYELDEIREGLEDAVKFHDRFKDVKEPLSQLIPAETGAPLARLDQALKQKSKDAFLAGYHGLTTACNACHQAAQHPFIVIQDPKQADFSNQKYDR